MDWLGVRFRSLPHRILSSKNKVVSDFDPSKKFKRKRIKYLYKSEVASVNKIQYEFAVYQRINFLMTKASEANDPDNFVNQAASYKIKSVRLLF
jgi:hypothetical protein